MCRIKILDPQTINKIAAGEIIDRPASIVKELIENSLDAKASTISVDIENGGKTLIKISDNGHGISQENLKLAPLRHATSKLAQIEDLNSIESLGFRGEALASMCHVGNLEIYSKTTSEEAYYLQAFEKDISEPELTTHNNGTTVIIKNIFQNLPVRKKFLKSDGTEFSYIFEVLLQFALIYTDIDFILTNNKKEVLNTTGIKDQEKLIIYLLGKDLKNQLIKLSFEEKNIIINGFISKPSFFYPNRTKYYIGVNKRIVKNPLIQKAATEAYSDLIPASKYPFIALNIQTTQNEIDVNIHPQKTSIKFLNPNNLYNIIYQAIRSSIQTKEMAGFFKENQSLSPSSTSTPGKDYHVSQAKHLFSKDGVNTHNSFVISSLYKDPNEQHTKPEFFQFLNTYLIIKSDKKIFILDQHAAHERILYEKFRAKAQDSNSRQQLLISEIIRLDAGKYGLFLSHRNSFKELNFEIDEFGDNQIIVREVPIQFTEANIKDLIISLIDQMQTLTSANKNLAEEAIKEKLKMAACKAAIKAGQKLSSAETYALIQDLIKTPQNYTCPHGRPLFIKLDKDQLEKLFLRK
ncbi:DNA mismatch repair endonuclease MutL [Candidatus Margulisiibacteriota bacterium]